MTLPVGWTSYSVGDVATFKGGYSYKSADWKPSGYPVVKIANVRDGRVSLEDCSYIDELAAAATEDYKVAHGDLLMTLTGEIGAMGIYRGSVGARLNQRLCKVTEKDPMVLTRDYLHYFLSSPAIRQEMWARSQGAAQANISTSDIVTLKIPVPSIDEQRRIVATLEDHLLRLDKALADLVEGERKLEAMIRSQLSAEVFKHANAKLTAKDLGKWVTGGTPSSSNPEFKGEDVPFVTPGDVSYGEQVTTISRRISDKGADKVRRIPAPSVQVVCIGATLGKVGWSDVEVTTNQQINSLIPDGAVIDARFAAMLLSTPEIQERLWAASSSTTVPILNKSTLEKLELRVPLVPNQLQALDSWSRFSERTSQIASDLKLGKNLIAQAKRSILNAAFNGELQ